MNQILTFLPCCLTLRVKWQGQGEAASHPPLPREKSFISYLGFLYLCEFFLLLFFLLLFLFLFLFFLFCRFKFLLDFKPISRYLKQKSAWENAPSLSEQSTTQMLCEHLMLSYMVSKPQGTLPLLEMLVLMLFPIPHPYLLPSLRKIG